MLCRMIEEELLSTLPPGRLGDTECADADFTTCGHWVHRSLSPEGNAILSTEFASFLGDQAGGKGER